MLTFDGDCSKNYNSPVLNYSFILLQTPLAVFVYLLFLVFSLFIETVGFIVSVGFFVVKMVLGIPDISYFSREECRGNEFKL